MTNSCDHSGNHNGHDYLDLDGQKHRVWWCGACGDELSDEVETTAVVR